MLSKKAIEDFEICLRYATAQIEREYFKLPVAGDEKVAEQWRERVYAYELYHQLRCCMERYDSLKPYSLNGEIDKRGSVFFNRTCVKGSIPDLLLHVAGDSQDNLVAIEIKMGEATGLVRAAGGDLKKLGHFCNDLSAGGDLANYRRGIFMLVGDPGRNKLDQINVVAARYGAVEVWLQRQPLKSAECAFRGCD